MFRISRLQEILKGLPRNHVDRVIVEHSGDKYSKGFGCWNQLLAMVYGQLSGSISLREIEQGFNSQSLHHYHLGVFPVHRSTLAEANAQGRRVNVFASLAHGLMSRADRQLRREGEPLLYLLDSTSISLKGPGFDLWTKDNRTRHTQGIKVHVLYSEGQQVPLYQTFSAANVNDIEEALQLPIKPGARYVFDKGYCDYNWWSRIDAKGACFVTRFKRNAALTVEHRSAPDPANQILADERVRFSNKYPGGGRRNHYTKLLRCIVVEREGKDTPLILATNDLKSPAKEIAEHYRRRWQIELFFKWMKQHLKIKRFVGRSENAVRIQILCALITYLLLALYRKAHGMSQSMKQCFNEIRATLFQRPETEQLLARRRREHQAALLACQPSLFV